MPDKPVVACAACTCCTIIIVTIILVATSFATIDPNNVALDYSSISLSINKNTLFYQWTPLSRSWPQLHCLPPHRPGSKIHEHELSHSRWTTAHLGCGLIMLCDT